MTTLKQQDDTGIVTEYVDDAPMSPEVVVHRFADVEPIMDDVKAIKQVTDGRSKSGELYHVGRLPAIIVEAYCVKQKVSFSEFCSNPEHVRRILNDPDYKAFRIFEGQF